MRQITMAVITASRPLPLHPAAAPLRALGDFLIRMAEASPYARALDLLNGTSEEDLLAHGTTHEVEIRRILGSRYHL
jgi:hypothetical protein